MDGIGRRLERIAMQRAAAKREVLAWQIGEVLPDGFTVSVEDERIVVSGPRAVTRWLRDPALAMLRDVAGWFR
jgi:hypothetical protein